MAPEPIFEKLEETSPSNSLSLLKPSLTPTVKDILHNTRPLLRHFLAHKEREYRLEANNVSCHRTCHRVGWGCLSQWWLMGSTSRDAFNMLRTLFTQRIKTANNSTKSFKCIFVRVVMEKTSCNYGSVQGFRI